jgi:hypothetical protein
MSTIEAPREQEQIIGTVTGIIQKGADKWQAAILPDGSQYVKNLWTKDAALVQSLSTMIGQRLAFLCNVSHWNMQDGTAVRSLWIEATGQPAPGSPALQGPQQHSVAVPPQQAPVVVQPQAVPFQQAVPQDVKEQRIHRQTASKVAAIMLTHVAQEERTMSTLFTLAERLVAYYNEGMPNAETIEDLMQRSMPASIDEYPGNPDPDSDIPF